MSIYEVHLGSWARVPEEGNRFLTYRELAHRLVPYVKETGFTHIELLPVMEHPFSGSWGYQVLGFFAPTSRFGPPEDFKYFVDACHQAGLGVILDWVPGHFPEGRARPRAVRRHRAVRARRSAAGRAPGLGHADLQLRPQRGAELPAVERAVLARGISRRRAAGRRGRVDAVSRLLAPRRRVDSEPVRRAREPRGDRLPAAAEHADARRASRARSPRPRNRRRIPASAGRCTSAASGSPTSGTWAGCTTCSSTSHEDPVHRRWHHNLVTFSMLYAFTENFILPFSHDEVVHGKGAMLDKMPGDAWQKYATLRTLYGYMFGHPGKKLLFMGGEFGQWREWNHDRSLDWHLLDDPSHAALRRFVQDLNGHYRAEPVAVRVRLRSDRLPLDRLQRQREQRRLVRPLRARSPRLPRAGVQLHAGAARRLPDRRARARLLCRAAEQRRVDLRRQQRRQRRRRLVASPSPSHGFDQSLQPHGPAARMPVPEAALS